MKRLLSAAFALALLAIPAAAVPPSVSGAPGFLAIPYTYTPLTPGQHNLAPTSATKLTVPAGALYATICASTAIVRYTTDGTTTPTSAIGTPIAAATCISLAGATVLTNFNSFSASGTLDVEYFN
jgi:hypothetical protein